MKVGYARTSTVDQEAGFEAQIRDLKAAGCEEIFQEQVSSDGKRRELEKALQFVRKGDTLVVTKLDRLARSIHHLGEITAALEAKNVPLQILDLGVDTSTATGQLVMNVLGSVAQFERDMMLERQREGIAKAKGLGRYRGRKPVGEAKRQEALRLKSEGLKPAEIVRQMGIGKTTLYKIFAEAGAV